MHTPPIGRPRFAQTKLGNAIVIAVTSTLFVASAFGGAPASIAAHAAAGTHHEVVAQRARGGFLVVNVMLNGKGPFRFGIDTGAPGPVRLDKAVAEQLGVKPHRVEIEGDGSGQNDHEVPVIRVNSLQMGSFKTDKLEANINDLRGRGFDLDGIFGMDAFKNHILTLDYGKAIVAVDKGQLPPSNGRDIVDYTLTPDGLIIVELAIGKLSFKAVLDTGQVIASLFAPEQVAQAIGCGAPREAGKARTVSNEYATYENDVCAPVRIGTTVLPVTKVRHPAVSEELNLGGKAMEGGILRLDQRNKRLQIIFP